LADNTTELEDDRKQRIKELYFAGWSALTDTALTDERLRVEDAYDILRGLAQYLNQYQGDLTDDDFQSWAADIIQPAVQFYAIKRECTKRVYAAIWKVLKSGEDLGICDDSNADDIAQRVWIFVLNELDSLTDPKQPAKPSTRLYAVARDQARAVKQTALRSRARFVDSEVAVRIGRDKKGKLFIEPDEPRPLD